MVSYWDMRKEEQNLDPEDRLLTVVILFPINNLIPMTEKIVAENAAHAKILINPGRFQFDIPFFHVDRNGRK